MQLVVLSPDTELTPALRQCCWSRDVGFSVVTSGRIQQGHFPDEVESPATAISSTNRPLAADRFVCQVLGSTGFPTLVGQQAPAQLIDVNTLRSNLQFCDAEGIGYLAILPGHSHDDVAAEYAGIILDRPKTLVITCDWLFGSGISSVLGGLVLDVLGGNRLSLDNGLALSPTQADHMAVALLAIIEQLACGARSWGGYHFENPDFCTEFGFAECVAKYVAQFADVDVSVLEVAGRSAAGSNGEGGIDPGQPTLGEEKKSLLHNFGIKQISWRMGLVTRVRQLVADAALKQVH